MLLCGGMGGNLIFMLQKKDNDELDYYEPTRAQGVDFIMHFRILIHNRTDNYRLFVYFLSGSEVAQI